MKDGQQQHQDIHRIKHIFIIDSSSFHHINMTTIHSQVLKPEQSSFGKVRLLFTKSSNFNFIHTIEFKALTYN